MLAEYSDSLKQLYKLYTEEVNTNIHKESSVPGIPSLSVVPYDIIEEEGYAGVSMMLSQLYKYPPTTADVFDGKLTTDLEKGGLSEEICQLGSILLGRTVERFDQEVVRKIISVEIILEDKAFDKLTEVLSEKSAEPNQTLINLMNRKKRFK